MGVQDTQNQTFFNKLQSSDNSWQMIDGHYVNVLSDNKGQYFIKGGTEKVYLTDYYDKKDRQAKKDQIQSDINNFFAGQENDFAGWRDYYASKIAMWTAKADKNKSIYQMSRQVVQAKEDELQPLYDKYNTYDVSKFSDGTDKRLGTRLLSDKKHAKSEGNIAFGQMQTENWIADGYRKLMNHSEMCRSVINKMAESFKLV